MKDIDYQSFWAFEREVKSSRRYIYSQKTQSLLDFISASLHSRVAVLPKGYVLYRSQIGYKWYYEDEYRWLGGFEEDRMKPSRTTAAEGRANPKGIPVLYLSSDKETSMSELRPAVGAIISCGKFQLCKDIKIVDCFSNIGRYSVAELAFGEPANHVELADRIWYQIGNAFSTPVSNSDRNADYVPTQILAELFRESDFDGLAFSSHLAKGTNYILFDMFSADMVECHLHEVNSVECCFKPFDESERALMGRLPDDCL